MIEPQTILAAQPTRPKAPWGVGIFFFLTGMLFGSFAGMQMLEDVIRRARTGVTPDGPLLTTVLVLFFSVFALFTFIGAASLYLNLREALHREGADDA